MYECAEVGISTIFARLTRGMPLLMDEHVMNTPPPR